jgi:hypothetical protein
LELKFAEGCQRAGGVESEVSLDLVYSAEEVSIKCAVDLFILLGEGMVFGLRDAFAGEREDGGMEPVSVGPVDW